MKDSLSFLSRDALCLNSIYKLKIIWQNTFQDIFSSEKNTALVVIFPKPVFITTCPSIYLHLSANKNTIYKWRQMLTSKLAKNKHQKMLRRRTFAWSFLSFMNKIQIKIFGEFFASGFGFFCTYFFRICCLWNKDWGFDLMWLNKLYVSSDKRKKSKIILYINFFTMLHLAVSFVSSEIIQTWNLLMQKTQEKVHFWLN